MKLLGLPLELCSDKVLRVVGDNMGKTINIDDSYRHFVYITMVCMLVEMDLKEDLLESIEIVVRGITDIQMVDSIRIPFRCARVHIYGLSMEECM